MRHTLNPITEIFKSAKGLSWKTTLVITAGWIAFTLFTHSCTTDFKVKVKDLEISTKHR
jgi:hypothetical protein